MKALQIFFNRLILIACCAALPAVAGAATPTDAQLKNPDVQAVVKQIRDLADKARANRAANTWLLDEMDTIVRTYYYPWPRNVLNEDFRDGAGSSWRVVSGDFRVDRTLGLRSQAPRPTTTASSTTERKTFAALLMDAFVEYQGGTSGTGTAADQYKPALLEMPLSLSNAFAMETSFTQHQTTSEPSRIAYGLYTDAARSDGYVIAFRTGTDPAAELRRVKGRSSTVLDRQTLSQSFGAGVRQDVTWRRDPDGNMVVLLNNGLLLQTRDRSTTSGFRALGISNRGGDYAVQRVAINGT